MALPKRRSRKLVVDGHTYRWAVSPDSGYMTLVIEEQSGRGQRLLASLDYFDVPDSPKGALRQTQQVTPALVRETILAGLAAGWRPLQPGKEMRHNQSRN